ncbi:MAG TPA: GGDEF domain-containing protein, partial [Methylophilaceae bacterium]|nr:GGDEF domain-containing protein [Methylophilaceae bacterium]
MKPLANDKQKLITALCILLSMGFIITSFASYFVSRETIRESIIEDELPLTSDNIYSEIQKDLVRPTFISSMMASDTFLRDWIIDGEKDLAQITKYLGEIRQR